MNEVNLLEVLVAGFLQGLLEWFPVSSSGQVLLFLSSLMGLSLTKAFSIALYLHVGTLLSVIVYYRRDIASHLSQEFLSLSNPLTRLWVITTIVSLIVGYPVYKLYNLVLSGVSLDVVTGLIGLLLVLTGAMLLLTGRGIKLRAFTEMGLRDYILLGIAQGVSVIPGVSRSGLTIAVLLLLGFKASESVRISFLASIPVIALATLYVGYTSGYAFSPLMLLGLASAFASGLLGIWIMNTLARRIPLYYFAITVGLIMALASIPLLFL